MKTLYMVLIIIGVIIGLMALLILLETMTKEETNETVVKNSPNENTSCGSGACSACSFQLFEGKEKKVKGESSCNIY